MDEASRVLGFVQLYPAFSSVRMARAMVLNDLFVTSDARGRGVAQALVAAAETFAGRQGATSLSLATARENVPAQSLYRALGWREDDAFLHFNRRLDP